jgi:hypothetical protein
MICSMQSHVADNAYATLNTVRQTDAAAIDFREGVLGPKSSYMSYLAQTREFITVIL